MKPQASTKTSMWGQDERATGLAMLYESVRILTEMAARYGLELSVVIEPLACLELEHELASVTALPESFDLATYDPPRSVAV